MADLSSLKKSITQMSNEELQALILDTRKRRRSEEPKKKAAAKKKSAAKKKTKKSAMKTNGADIPVNQLLNNMTPEQKAELLKSLEG